MLPATKNTANFTVTFWARLIGTSVNEKHTIHAYHINEVVDQLPKYDDVHQVFVNKLFLVDRTNEKELRMLLLLYGET